MTRVQNTTIVSVEPTEKIEEAEEMPVESEEDVFGIENGVEDGKIPGLIKLNPSVENPLDLELKELSKHLKYAFMEKGSKLLVIIASNLSESQ